MNLLALGLVILLQVDVVPPTLDDVLEQLDEGGGAHPTALPTEVGREALARIDPFAVDAASLERLAGVARASDGVMPLLVQRLFEVVVARGAAAPAAVRLLTRLSDEALPAKAPDELVDLLGAWCVGEEEDTACDSATLLGRWGSSTAFATAMLAYAPPGFAAQRRALVAHLPSNRVSTPLEWVSTLSALPVASTDETLTDALGVFARDLAGRDLAAADALLERAASGVVGPGASLLRGLGGVRLDDTERRARASALVLTYVEPAAEDVEEVHPVLLCAALEAGGELMLDELVPVLPTFASRGPTPPVRVAAIEALGWVGYRDAPTIDLLIELLGDGDATVQLAAHTVLCAKTGQRMPGRKVVWDQWRASQKLPPEAPRGHLEWLAGRRRVEAQLRAAAAARERLVDLERHRAMERAKGAERSGSPR